MEEIQKIYDEEVVEEEPGYEPEWCEDCSDEANESGFEYEFNYHAENGSWICDHCGKPL
jgi:hypothetical protein